uniref:NADH-ubiquinone oxidoreductase chain 5 n=1 Tax=Macrostemum floridum TaxID=486976 RepID=A0A7L8XEW1_9NEOP|nr:NADH dehydrogenase subunit 5 [Macrostemum floridum]QOH91259.1 NADH dehydrogenase subunit 5 [Macrostemum floridum]
MLWFKENLSSNVIKVVVSMLGMFLVMMMMIFFFFFKMGLSVYLEMDVVSLNSLKMVLMLYIDWMSLIFSGFVMLISFSVVFYCKSYTSSELYLNRFIILVFLFVISMFLLIFSLNLISIMVGWDGLGVTSFLLVIYYQNFKSLNSGVLTILSNRIGDVMILLGIGWSMNFGSWGFMFYYDLISSESEMKIILFFLILGAMTKSAQIPFSAWLPAAMAAPTPVSALVHSSTLVTAGVYLMIRFYEIMKVSEIFILMKILFLLGCLTTIMASFSALVEYDLKKIIALSTLSQLGFMMSILMMGSKMLAFYHLLIHAIFKALLFMCAGLIIHSLNDCQDIRFMGNLGKFMPLVSLSLNISNLALIGFPFMAGFYSKDLVMELVMMMNMNFMLFFFFFFSISLTLMYTIRLSYYLLFMSSKFSSFYLYYDSDYLMVKSMFMLTIFSIFMGSLMMWMLFEYPMMIYLFGGFKYMILIMMMIGGVLGMLSVVIWGKMSKKILFKMFKFMGLMFYLPSLSVNGLNFMGLNISLGMIKSMEMGWIDKLISGVVFNYLINWSLNNYLLIFTYFKVIMIMFILMIFYFML